MRRDRRQTSSRYQRGLAAGPAGGVTILELLITIALVFLLAVLAMPFVANTIGRQQVDLLSDRAVDALREAQFSTMTGKHDTAHGVHFEFDRFVYFQGSSYNPADGENVEQLLADSVTISDIDLTGGASDVRFQSRRGTPVETGTVTFTGPDGDSRTVTVGAGGAIESD